VLNMNFIKNLFKGVLILLLLVVAIAGSVWGYSEYKDAQELKARTAHADDEITMMDVCTGLSLIAEQVMISRQQDRPMSEALPETTDLLKDLGDKYGREEDMLKLEKMAAILVMSAYEETISPVEKYRRMKITAFENANFKACYESWASDSEE
jgi:hypothetical protein